MEKKEREELKKRYLKFAEDDRCIAFIPDGGGDENNLYLDDIFEDVEEELLDFISQELDKAREEGYQKAVTQIMEDYGEYFNDGCGCCSTKLLNDELSKLKDNK
jgi:hypothetical protein